MSPAVIHAACDSTGWFTKVDLDGCHIEPCEDCNPGGVAVPMPMPSAQIRTAVLAALPHDLRPKPIAEPVPDLVPIADLVPGAALARADRARRDRITIVIVGVALVAIVIWLLVVTS